jgi:hypothetical protein
MKPPGLLQCQAIMPGIALLPGGFEVSRVDDESAVAHRVLMRIVGQFF